MRNLLRVISLSLMLSFFGLTVNAQQNFKLIGTGSGNFMGYSATVEVEQYYYDSGSWDGSGDYIKSKGVIKTEFGSITFYYEDYARLPPYEGYLYLPQGAIKIGVLDSSGGKMYIEDGSYKRYLNATEQYGEFIIQWRKTGQ